MVFSIATLEARPGGMGACVRPGAGFVHPLSLRRLLGRRDTRSLLRARRR